MTTSPTVLRVLRDRNAGRYLTGLVVNAFGSSALWLASGIWVKDLTGSNGLAGLCLLALWAPTLAGPALGTLADRVRRKPLIITVNLAVAALLLTLFTVDSPARLWLLFLVLFLYGTADAVTSAAESALVTAVVPGDLLGDFNGLRMTITEGMKLVAPLTGAGLYAAFGGPAVACLDAASFVVTAALCALIRVREERPVRPAGGDWRHQTAEGVRYLWRHDRLRPLIRAGGTTLLITSLASATLYAVIDRLGHSPAYAGVLYAFQGAGSVAVGLLTGPALRRLGERWFAAAGIALTGLALVARAVPFDAVALVSSLAAGLGLPCVLIAALTAVQRETPGPLLGRVTATANTLMYTPNVIGLAAGAGLVELAGPGVLLLCYGLAMLATAVPLLQRAASASRTAARSPSDANPA
ncbi:MFS transporter [Streptomyces sp. NPDC048106]|uniref:MFS transporter n=1 Tax=Streptomyces sp. NPDC048106 TaxID=3155750 RepID=UPI003454277E